MVWRELLLIVALGSAWVPTQASLAFDCNSGTSSTTGCINGDSVDIHGTQTTPGSGGGGGSGSGTGGDGSFGADPIMKCMARVCPKVEPVKSVTLSDIASFRPTPGAQRMQPDGWTVPGLETNFYALARTHVVEGTLLGEPAAVRFTPVSFHWQYGDGSTATRSTPGATWAALHRHEFDRTATSHVYTQKGDYTIRLVIDFAAEYRFAGSPFHPIDGVIPLPANDLQITVDDATTVLVERDCAANPTGPGC
jgi:hypothetical protein